MLEALAALLFLVLPAAAAAWLAAAYALEHRRDRIPILLYHRLIRRADAEAGRVEDDERVWASYDTVFAEQMDLLREEGFSTLDLDDYLQIRSGEQPLPAKPVVVTFDDGYLSNFTLAFPTLQRNRQKATIFVALEPDEHTRQQVEGIDGFLSSGQLAEMAQSGISIQSHSLTHRILTELSEEEVAHELVESRRRLEAMTSRPVRHLAIPRAGYNRKVRARARALGYATVCCNNKGSATGWSDPWALPRIVVDRDMSAQDLIRALSPRGGFVLRVVGNVKRIPERLGGARFARRVRNLLYRGPWAPAFTPHNLKRLVVIVGMAYLGGGLLLAWRLVTTWPAR